MIQTQVEVDEQKTKEATKKENLRLCAYLVLCAFVVSLLMMLPRLKAPLGVLWQIFVDNVR